MNFQMVLVEVRLLISHNCRTICIFHLTLDTKLLVFDIKRNTESIQTKQIWKAVINQTLQEYYHKLPKEYMGQSIQE